jgi:TRAP-type mannitol/chloroaromatic compound transport system permease small subunit
MSKPIISQMSVSLADKIDGINKWIGKAISAVILVTVAATVIEVIARYLFNAPTTWAYEVEMFTCGILYVFVGAYVLLHNGHVGVDMVYNRLSPKWQLRMNLIVTYPLILIMTLVLVYIGWDFAWTSFVMAERSYTSWAPLLWPIKISLPIGSALMVLQVISKIIRDVNQLKGSSQ